MPFTDTDVQTLTLLANGMSFGRNHDAIRHALREIERLRAALEVIAGRHQCLDNLMSNVAIAEAALC